MRLTTCLEKMQNETMNFSEKLGEGGFGSVFKGTLGDTSVVAVKKLESTSHVEKHFQMETTKLGKVQHVNLVRLHGFCSEGCFSLLQEQKTSIYHIIIIT